MTLVLLHDARAQGDEVVRLCHFIRRISFRSRISGDSLGVLAPCCEPGETSPTSREVSCPSASWAQAW